MLRGPGKQKKSLGGQRNDGTLIETLISLNQDIERLEVRPLPKFSSITYIAKLVDENDIRQLLGTYELCQFQTGAAEKSEIRPPPMRRVMDAYTKITEAELKKDCAPEMKRVQVSKSVSEFDDQIQTVVRSIKEEGNKLKSMVDQYTANRISSLQKQARKESKRLASILSENKSALDIAYTLDNRKRRFDVEKNDAILLKMSKRLLIDIDRLEVRPLPDFPSVTCNPKVVHENDISQLLGMYDFQETKIRTADGKIDKMPSPMRKERFYTCGKCGNQKTFPHGTCYHHLIDHFICCKKNMDRHYRYVFE
ncbi:unnamed protein product [Mytilus coruscus]|uniref:Uncharacterized protein n=1 Tax=Mytilus coruscus TaxID=42192 RepID=A0A6J8DEY6_MYTCO|nr:unnamed protein product [Mytilus coruscus]